MKRETKGIVVSLVGVLFLVWFLPAPVWACDKGDKKGTLIHGVKKPTPGIALSDMEKMDEIVRRSITDRKHGKVQRYSTRVIDVESLYTRRVQRRL